MKLVAEKPVALDWYSNSGFLRNQLHFSHETRCKRNEARLTKQARLQIDSEAGVVLDHFFELL
jgi:hypothetical protein